MTIKQLAAAKAIKRLSFSSITEVVKDQDGKYIVTLQLKVPIPEVKGSRPTYMQNVLGIEVPTYMRVENVTHLRLHEDNMTKGFRVYKNSITYQGTLVLDISNKCDVWMSSESFQSIADRYRRKQRMERILSK